MKKKILEHITNFEKTIQSILCIDYSMKLPLQLSSDDFNPALYFIKFFQSFFTPNLQETLKHNELIERMQACGYKIDVKGQCRGIDKMAEQAGLADEGKLTHEPRELEKYNQLLKKIKEIPLTDFSDNMAPIKAKIANYKATGDFKSARELNQLMIDILAFFDGVALYQSPAQFKHVLNHSPTDALTQFNSSEVTSVVGIVSNDKTPKQLATTIGAYTKSELTQYFNLLKNNFTDYNFSLSILAKSHFINVNYNTNDKCWYFTDANDLPTKKIKDTEELSNIIFKNFRETDRLVMRNEFSVSTQNYKEKINKFATIKELDSWKNLHDPSKKTSTDDKSMQLFYAVSIPNNQEQLKSLIRNGADVNYKVSHKSILHEACICGNLENVITLLEEGADINITTDEGLDILHVACISGALNIVEYLLNNGIEPNLSHLILAQEYNNTKISELLQQNPIIQLQERINKEQIVDTTTLMEPIGLTPENIEKLYASLDKICKNLTKPIISDPGADDCDETQMKPHI